jgi:hypothetical protein
MAESPPLRDEPAAEVTEVSVTKTSFDEVVALEIEGDVNP